MGDGNAPSSYVVNQQVFGGAPRLPGSIPDGTSNTIAISQHYYLTKNRPNKLSYLFIENRMVNIYSSTGNIRGGTFADPAELDVVPVTQGNPPTTRASRPGVTFQLVPSLDQADGRMLQATQAAGLFTAMFDGSVRTFGPSVSEEVFWAAVTPAGGETAWEP
jgi:hypothetical protein